jgi:pimeloyl-ACP methyl ester carboxylesterase
MHASLRGSAVLASIVLVAGCTAVKPQEDPAPASCHTGVYRFEDGATVILTPSEGAALRYRLADGRSGRLYPRSSEEYEGGDGWAEREPVVATARLQDCERNYIDFRLRSGPAGRASKVELPRVPAYFESLGNRLYGELYLPADTAPRALVVLAYGSGRDSAVAFNYLQHLLPLHGIAAFVFDKRGTGRSGGPFTVDFSALADDTIAALAAARGLLTDSTIPAGVLGESQGGWVAPLAAARTPVDFVIVAYGLAIGPLEEDREEVSAELRAQGYGDAVLADAQRLTAITGRVLLSRFTDGVEELARFKAAHAADEWLKHVEGDYTGPMVRGSMEDMEALRDALAVDAILDYDAAAALRRVQAPMLWVVAGKDTEAPSPPTLAVLRDLQRSPTQLDIAVFPDADHGMIDVEDTPGGRRLLRYSPGYHDLLVQWILRQSLDGAFGAAQLEPDRNAAAGEHAATE